MVVPLFIGMVINTFFPPLLKIGGFTEALTNVGYPTILGHVPVHRGHQDDGARRAAHAEARLRHHGCQGRHCHDDRRLGRESSSAATCSATVRSPCSSR